MINDILKKREKIDKIDRSLITLLSERFALSKKIGVIKRKEGLNLKDAEREKQLHDLHQAECEKFGVDKNVADKIFDIIIKQSRKIQKRD